MPQTTISLLGIPFSISTPYEPGYSITPGEAKFLHTSLVDILRNNFIHKVRARKEEIGEDWPNAIDTHALQREFDEYVRNYDFGSIRDLNKPDPFEIELDSLANLVLKKKLRKEGIDPNTLDPETHRSYLEKVRSHPQVVEEARRKAAIFQDTAISALEL